MLESYNMFANANFRILAIALLFTFGLSQPCQALQAISADKVIGADGKIINQSMLSRVASFIHKKFPTPAHKIIALAATGATIVVVGLGCKFAWDKLHESDHPTGGQNTPDNNDSTKTPVPDLTNTRTPAGDDATQPPLQAQPAQNNPATSQNPAPAGLGIPKKNENPIDHYLNREFKALLPQDVDSDEDLQNKLIALAKWDKMSISDEYHDWNSDDLHQAHRVALHRVASKYFKSDGDL